MHLPHEERKRIQGGLEIVGGARHVPIVHWALLQPYPTAPERDDGSRPISP